jgi:hypothetical protein
MSSQFKPWLLLVVAVLSGCNPRPYRSGSDASADHEADVEATVEWLETTFAGIYQLDSYHVSEGSCSIAGVNRRAEAGDFFWVHADTGLGPFAEMCVCGASVEECESFAAAVKQGELLRCTLQRRVTDRVTDLAATERIDVAGTWDGANNCLQGGTEVVTFERSSNQIEIDHQQTLIDYVVPDGMCTPDRARIAAQGRPCTMRGVISGTLINLD